ncbi:hypothetical protein ARMSODRAFT_417104 [Armillaria solidipes]|uniref:Uncharacterized protein n=1 Tax=Armillaria solidipes TaxID=1076256 RepID=A0A2H3C3T2_9AGAR|nr:hypothetical protein ARMSODRAFT_417104 [Armillaria solidipes]
MFDNRLQFIYSLILPRPPFEIPPSHHDPIRCITNPRRHTLNPSKISWDSAQDYGADQTLTLPTSPHTPEKIARQRRNSVADTPASIVSKKSRRATACCCSCHCPYTTPKHSVNSELNVIHAAPPSPLVRCMLNDNIWPALTCQRTHPFHLVPKVMTYLDPH